MDTQRKNHQPSQGKEGFERRSVRHPCMPCARLEEIGWRRPSGADAGESGDDCSQAGDPNHQK